MASSGLDLCKIAAPMQRDWRYGVMMPWHRISHATPSNAAELPSVEAPSAWWVPEWESWQNTGMAEIKYEAINPPLAYSRETKRVAIFRDTRNGVPSDFGSEKLATTMPSAARARPAFVCGADTSLRSHRPLLHSDSTPVRLPYVLSPPAMEPQTSTKHPALRLRGGRRTSCAPSSRKNVNAVRAACA